MAPTRRTTLLGAVAALLSGCAAGPPTVPLSGVDGLLVPTPSPDPDDFVVGPGSTDNPWLPLRPGREWVYEAADGSPGTTTVTVLDETRQVAGLDATVVREVVVDQAGTIREETFRWYAGDRAGNVWLLGEDRTERDDRGSPLATESWEAGVADARAGLAMPARPRLGDGYVVAAPPGEGELRAEVVSTSGTATVPVGSYEEVLVVEQTDSSSGLVVVRGHHARGVGPVLLETGGGSTGRFLLTATTAPD